MLQLLDVERLSEMVNPDDTASAVFTTGSSSQASSMEPSQASSMEPTSQASSVFSFGSNGSHNSDAYYKSSQGSQGSARSVSPLPVLPTEMDGGGSSNKKTRRRKSSHNRRKRTRKIMKRTMKRIIKRNITNKKSRFNMNTRKIKNKKFPKRIYLYSTPRTAQHMAYKYLGKTNAAKLYPAKNPAKKYMIFDPKNNKWVNFGQMGYEDYTKHHNKTRRKNYLTRTKGMLGNWKNNKYSANNLSRHILW
jgi:hypothetical protein